MAKPPKPIAHLGRKLQLANGASFALLGALIALFSYWNFERATPVIWLAQALPLLAFLPGMLKAAPRAYNWLCFVLLFYFIFAVQRCFLSLAQWSDFLFLTLVVLLFVAAMFASRWRQYHQYFSNEGS